MLTSDQQEKFFENYLGTNSEYINLEENVESQKVEAKACSVNIIEANIGNQVAGDQADERESEDELQEIKGQKRINDDLV